METLPTGTITFLYTDIEGSTIRWERNPGAMKAAVERHDTLMRRAIEANGGQVFRIMGDAFCASFYTAPQALSAALEAQRAINSEAWDPAVSPIKVRMALHTGIGEVRDGDYVGTPLNRIARLLSTGYGGQTLLSRAAYDLVRDNLPPGVAVRDLGEHHLKDLAQPEHVFDLVTSDLPSDFPPLKTLDSRPNNLPTQPTPLVGRTGELQNVCSLVKRPDTRLVTLTGPGGIGKTRLALQAAADLLDDFDDGVYFVPLAPLLDAGLVALTIAQSLGMRDIGTGSALESVKEYLRNKQMLLVLDNFEQVVSGGARQVADLLAACPGVKALVASREVLRIRGEKECAVPPLSLPDLDNMPAQPTPQDLMQYESVALFVQRAEDVKGDFEIDEDNARAVAEICRRLDGLPLAIELAAARIKVLSPQAMLVRLKSRLSLLTGGARDLPERQQTLRNTIAWSYDLLPTAEQTLFTRLSVFVGGFTLEAAEAVCGAETGDDPRAIPVSGTDGDIDLLEGLMALADKSLLRQEEHLGGESRFMMLETIREFARQMLEGRGEADEMRKRHAQYYAAFASQFGSLTMTPGRWHAIALLESEHDNLRAALEWCSARSEYAMLGLSIAADLAMFWDYKSLHQSEGRAWLAKMLTLPENAARTGIRGNALMGVGMISMALGDYGPARAWLEESVSICEEVDDRICQLLATTTLALTHQLTGDTGRAIQLGLESIDLINSRDPGTANRVEVKEKSMRLSMADWAASFVYFVLGDAYLTAGDLENARTSLLKSLDLYKKIGATDDATLPLTSLGKIAFLQGNYDEARALIEEGLAIRRKQGDRWFIAISLTTLSDLARYQGDYERVEKLSQESLTLFRKVNNIGGMAWALYNLGYSALHRGDIKQATDLFKQSLTLRKDQGNKQKIAEDLLGLAEIARAEHNPLRTAQLLGAISRLISEGTQLETPEKAAVERNINIARSQLGEAGYQAAWAEGHAMSVDEAADFALR